MKYFIWLLFLATGFLICLVLLSACTTITYQDGGSKFTRTSFGTQLQITELKATISPKGERTIRLKGYNSDQAEALGAVAEGITKGLAQGATP